MVACFLRGELTSDRFGEALRSALHRAHLDERLLLDPDLDNEEETNDARQRLLGETRGYRRDEGVFDEGFASDVEWIWAELHPKELARVRYIDYSYWNDLSGGSRLPVDAAKQIRLGQSSFGVPHERFLVAASALAAGDPLPPMIFAGPGLDSMVCLEGHLRLTAHALAGFPNSSRCLVGTSARLATWAK